MMPSASAADYAQFGAASTMTHCHPSPVYQNAPMASPAYGYPQPSPAYQLPSPNFPMPSPSHQNLPTPPPTSQGMQISPQFPGQRPQDPMTAYAYQIQMAQAAAQWPQQHGWDGFGMFVTPGVFPTGVVHPAHQAVMQQQALQQAALQQQAMQQQQQAMQQQQQVMQHQHQQLAALRAVSVEKPRARRAFSEAQLAALAERYKEKPNIAVEERRALSKKIGLTPEQIKIWFQNRRFKGRKMAALEIEFMKKAEDKLKKAQEKKE